MDVEVPRVVEVVDRDSRHDFLAEFEVTGPLYPYSKNYPGRGKQFCLNLFL